MVGKRRVSDHHIFSSSYQHIITSSHHQCPPPTLRHGGQALKGSCNRVQLYPTFALKQLIEELNGCKSSNLKFSNHHIFSSAHHHIISSSHQYSFVGSPRNARNPAMASASISSSPGYTTKCASGETIRFI